MAAMAEERFWAKINKNGPLILKSRCWTWTAFKRPNGYGAFRSRLAHRFSYELHNGAIPKGLCVCHRCDVRDCVNPEHLFLGTHLDNAKDRDHKGRCSRLSGESNAIAKLTDKQVMEIRSRPIFRGSGRALAKEFCVSPGIISEIISRKRWKHI